MNQLEVGVVGAGWIADKHLRAIEELDDNVRVVAICDLDKERAHALAEAFQVLSVLDDFDDMGQMDRVNTVLVAIPTMSHADVAVASAQAGKHVVCEKPMAATLADCRRMIDAARQNHVTLTPVHNRLFFPPIVEAKRIIDRGEIGRPQLYRANFTTPYHPARFHGGDEVHWRYDAAKSGGGVMMESGVHLIYVAHHLMGRVRSVQVQSWAHDEQSVEECATVQMTFESQVLGSLVMQWGSGIAEHSMHIVGTEGALLINGIERQAMRASPLAVYHRKDESWRMPNVQCSWEQTFVGLWSHLSEALLDGAPHRLTGMDGCDAIAVIEAAYHAKESGAEVEVRYLEP